MIQKQEPEHPYLARMSGASIAMSFCVVGGLLGTLCVPAINTINVLTHAARLFWTMFTWQRVILHYLERLNASHAKTG